jgi:hypothetical protein
MRKKCKQYAWAFVAVAFCSQLLTLTTDNQTLKAVISILAMTLTIIGTIALG